MRHPVRLLSLLIVLATLLSLVPAAIAQNDPPAQVIGIEAGQRTVNSLQVQWDRADSASFYRVYRDGEEHATTTFTSFTDVELNASTTHTYRVSAVDGFGNEGQRSSPVTLTTLQADEFAPLMSGLETVDSTQSSIRVVWQTDEEADSEVRFGLNEPDQIVREEGPRTNHSVRLTGLDNGTTYNLYAISCDPSGNCANLTSRFTAGLDTTPPPLNISIPRYLNRVSFDIVGTTEPFSEVALFVNNMNTPRRFLEREDTGEDGAIRFRGIFLDSENVIRLVATDKTGNVNERLYEVTVDTDEPIVSFSGIPSVTSRKNVTFSGSVNEQTSIRVFVESAEQERSPPLNVSGLHNTTVGTNFISLAWDQVQDDDFSHYIIRRSDVGPIAVANPATYTGYTDILVDSGREYTYQLSYMNIYGEESERSDPITVTTEEGGAITNIKPPKVDINRDFREPAAQFNASGSFSSSFELDDGDGDYDVRIIVEDRAGNRVVREQRITLDTTIPTIEITSPPSNALLFENYADEVDIEGTTEPGARVYLYVGRTPFNSENLSFDIPGVKDNIQNLDQSDLEPDCEFVVRSENICPHSADHATTAGADGTFTFENVDVNSMFSGAGRISQSSVTNFGDSDNTALREQRNARLVFVASDKAGLRNVEQHQMRVGNCWSGNLSWDVIPLTEYQRPTTISTERLAENTENIYFYFNYSYTGIGEDPSIQSVSLARACGDFELLDDRFQTSCKVLPAGGQGTQLNPEHTLSYSTINLNRIQGMDQWLKGEWESFFDAVGTEMTFPFRMTITYEHEVEGEMQTETQTTCQEVTYALDNTRIDPRSVLPDWLLYDFVGFLDDSVRTISDIQTQVDKLIQYVAPTCLMSFGVNFGATVLRNWEVHFTEAKLKFGEVGEIIGFGDSFTFNVQDEQTAERCKALVESFEKSDSYSGFKLEYLSDTDLETCFPDVASSWDTEQATYQAYRYTCDRLFGHSAPSRWTETKTDEDLLERVEQGNTCALDESAKGQHLRASSCRELSRDFDTDVAYEAGERCITLLGTNQNNGQTESLFKVDQLVDEATDLYRLERVAGPSQNAIMYAVKVNEDNFITQRPQTCAQICGTTDASNDPIAIDGNEVSIQEGGDGGDGQGSVCLPANRCNSLNAQTQRQDLQLDGERIVSAQREGYTEGCFYDQNGGRLSNPNVVSDDPDLRMECCCLRTESTEDGEENRYYAAGDRYKDVAVETASRRLGSEEGIHVAQEEIPQGAEFEPIEWSYRYWKNDLAVRDGQSGELKTGYNPYRYVEGRDHAACFGQNHWAYSLFGNEENVLVIEPSDDPIASLQCANLGGIQNWLTTTSNAMNLMSTCLKSVRTTGTADSGACKELFTQYVCSFAWDVVQFAANAGNSCNSFMPDIEGTPEDEDLGIIDYVSGGLGGIYSAMADKQQEFTSEYSNTKLQQLFGTGGDAVARKVCLAAFGYDWEINSQALIDASYAQPFASLVQATTASREFLTAEPDGESRHEYRASWIINPGCDLRNYDVSLACITREELDAGIGADCTEQNSKDGINCACLDMDEEQTRSFFREGSPAGQNDLVDQDHHEIVNSRYRYDHLKFDLRVDRDIDGAIADRCFPDGYEDGEFYFPITDRTPYDISDCRVEPVSGVYSCQAGDNFFSRKGTAYMQNLQINGEDADDVEVIRTGEPLRVSAEVTRSAEEDKCLLVELERINGRDKVWPISQNGYNQVPPLELTNRVLLSGEDSSEVISSLDTMTARKFSQDQSNSQRVDFSVRLEDTDGDRFFNAAEDAATIDGVRVEGGSVQGDSGSGTRITLADGNLVLQKNGAAVEITGAQFTLDGDSVDTLQATLTAPRASASETQQSGTAIITFGLYHLREGSESVNSVDDCSLNDPVIHSGDRQRESFTVRVVSQSADEVSNSENPQVRNFDVPADPLSPGSSAFFTAHITDNALVESASLRFTGLNGSSLTKTFEETGQDGYRAVVAHGDFESAGLYQAQVRALDGDSPQREGQSLQREFNVECAPDAICATSCDGLDASGDPRVVDEPSLRCMGDPDASGESGLREELICCKRP